MTQRNIINVVGDWENFLDNLLSHTEEQNCTHSVMDLLDEFFDFDNKNASGLSQSPNSNRRRNNSATNPGNEKEVIVE